MPDLATLALKVDSREVRTADADLDRLTASGRRAEGATDDLGRSATRASGAMRTFRNAIAALGLGVTIRELVNLADTFTSINSRLGLVTSNTAELARVSQDLFDVAQRTRTGFESVADLYTSLARTTGELGVSQAELLAVTETINQALIVSGANAASADAALRQLGQGFASGALRGDELNSVMEQTPRLAQAIADGMGITIGQLRALGAEGELTASKVFQALQSQADAIEQEFAQMPTTVGQAFTQLQNSILQFVGQANEALGATDAIVSALHFLGDNLGIIVRLLQATVVAFVAYRAAALASAIATSAYGATVITATAQLGLFAGAQVAATGAMAAFGVAGRGLIAMLGGPWGIAIAGVAYGLYTLATATDSVTQAVDELAAEAAESANALESLRDRARAAGVSMDAFTSSGQGTGSVMTQMVGWANAAAAAFDNLAISARNAIIIAARVRAIDAAGRVRERRGQRLAAWDRANRTGRDTDIALAESAEDRALAAGNVDLGIIRNSIESIRIANQMTDAMLETTNAADGAAEAVTRVGGASGGAARGISEAARAATEAERALEAATQAADGYIDALSRQRQELGQTDAGRQELEVQRQITAALAAGLEDRAKLIRQSADDLASATATVTSKQRLQDFVSNVIEPLQFETELLELNAVQQRTLRAERELTQANIERGSEAWVQYMEAVNAAAEAEERIEGPRRLAEGLREITRALDQLDGQIGRTLGNIGAIGVGFLTGDFSGARGEIGTILQLLSQGEDGQQLIDGFESVLDDVFGFGGSFAESLTTALQGAGIGAAASSLVLGKSGSAFGSAVGGAIGQIAGQAIGKTVGGLLGGAAGPLGAIAGGLLGGALGGLLKGTARGSAILNGASISGYYGGNSQREAAAGDLAGQVLANINKIVEALGGTLNAAAGSVSIGVRNNNLFVDPQGRGYTKQSKYSDILGFGQDAEAAVMAAAMDLIKDGVIEGLRRGTQTLLTASGDLNTQLSKALAFEAVFDELERMKNPAESALKQLKAEFDGLTQIFKEAGASAADYAALQELYALKQKELQAQEAGGADLSRERRELEIRIMELQGNAAGALAAARQLELEAMDASLRPLQEQIYALLDAAKTLDANRARNKQRRSLEAELLSLTGDAAGALAIQRQLELQAMDRSLRPLQREIYAAEDLNAARDDLAAAYDRESSSLQSTIDKFKDFSSSLREFRESLGGGDAVVNAYRAAQVKFLTVSALAAAGDEKALGDLQGVSTTFLSASRDRASSLVQYNRDVSAVARAVDAAIGAADEAVDYAQLQLDALENSVAGLIDINASVQSVEQAIYALGGNPPSPVTSSRVPFAENKAQGEDVRTEIAKMREAMTVMLEAVAKNTGGQWTLLKRWDRGDGMNITADADSPLPVTS